MQRRKQSFSQASSLPVDYLKLVSDVFQKQFAKGLLLYQTYGGHPTIEVGGSLYPDEIIQAISLSTQNHLSKVTAYASSDFDFHADPLVAKSKTQDILSDCLDALGWLFEILLSTKFPEKIEAFTRFSWFDLEGIPIDWTPLEFDSTKVFIRMDKANLFLDQWTDDWLGHPDPNCLEQKRVEEQATKDLFVVGPKKSLPKEEDLESSV